jgi:predicted small secreted protein
VNVKRCFPLLVALVVAGCDNTITGPAGTDTSGTTTTTSAPIIEWFEAAVSPGQSMFYSFTVTTSGPATATLAAVVQPPKVGALATPVRIAFGTPVGEGCDISDSVEATPSLTPQLGTTLAAGIHCVSVADSGQLTGTVIASVRFAHH